jgi:hypothetical protein
MSTSHPAPDSTATAPTAQSPSAQITGAKRFEAFLSAMTELILDNMMGSVAMPLILSRILRNHGKDEFGNFKSIVLGMLDNFTFERNLLQTTAHLLSQDVFAAAETFLATRRKAFTARGSSTCGACAGSLIGTIQPSTGAASDVAVAVFGCGHAYHGRCCPTRHCLICNSANTSTSTEGTRGLASAKARRSAAIFQPLTAADEAAFIASEAKAAMMPAATPETSQPATGSDSLLQYKQRLAAFDGLQTATTQQQRQQSKAHKGTRSSVRLSVALPQSPMFSTKLKGFSGPKKHP